MGEGEESRRSSLSCRSLVPPWDHPRSEDAPWDGFRHCLRKLLKTELSRAQPCFFEAAVKFSARQSTSWFGAGFERNPQSSSRGARRLHYGSVFSASTSGSATSSPAS